MIKKIFIIISLLFTFILTGCIDKRDLNADNNDYDYDAVVNDYGINIGAIHVITDSSYEYKSERFKNKIDHSGYVYILDNEFHVDSYTKTDAEFLTYSKDYEVKPDAYVTVVYLYYYSESKRYELASFNSSKVQVDCMMSQTIETNPKFMFERNYKIVE